MFCWSVCAGVTAHVCSVCDEECAFATVGLFFWRAGTGNESYQPSG